MPANLVTPTIGQASVGDAANSDNFVPEIWAKEIAANRTDNLVLWPLINSQYSSEISGKGDTLHIPFLDEIDDATTTNHVPGQDTPVDALDSTTSPLYIDRYIRKGVGIQDALKAQSAYELRSPLQQRLSRFLDRAKDEEIMTKAVAGFTTTPIPATGTGGSVAFADIVDAATVLDEANVPEDDRYIVMNSRGRGDLRKIPEFTSYKETGESGLVKTKRGLVGELYGMPVYITNAIKANTEATPSFDFMVFHKSAIIGAAQHVPRVENNRNASKGQDEIFGSELFGVSVLRPDHGVLVRRTV